MHVPLLVCLLSLCFVLITGTLQNGNQKAAREIAEKFTEMMERRSLEIEGNQQRSRWRQVKDKYVTCLDLAPAASLLSSILFLAACNKIHNCMVM